MVGKEIGTDLLLGPLPQVVNILELLVFIPAIGAITRIVVTLLSLFATWIAVTQAHELRGWHALVVPIAVIAILLISIFVLGSLIEGTALTVEAIFGETGISSQP